MSLSSPFVRGAAALASAALVLSSCSGNPQVPVSSKSSPGVTPTEIVLGSTQALSGLQASGSDEIAPAAAAVFKWVDAHGGVNGRQIFFRYVDDTGSPRVTVMKTDELLDDNMFADFNPAGTITQLGVRHLLNAAGVPQLFVSSGCSCWSDPAYRWTWGWQTNDTIEGKILGRYVATHFRHAKVGFIFESDALGLEGVRGLSMEIPARSIVAREGYHRSELTAAAGLGQEVARLRAAGAKVVVLFTTPIATAESMLAAATAGYHPQWVLSSAGSDAATLYELFDAFQKGQLGPKVLDGSVSDSFLPSPSDTANGWIQLFRHIYSAYDTANVARFDGYTEYGMAVAVTMVEALKAAGRDLTRDSLIDDLERAGAGFGGAGLLPPAYSVSNHGGFEGARMGVIGAGGFVESGPVYESSSSPGAPVARYRGAPLPGPPSFGDPGYAG